MTPLDFLAIGDTVADTFIKLEKDRAKVACDEHGEHCTISMAYGDKIPFENATFLPGVGNSANAAVCAARLGLSSGILTWVGADRTGEECRKNFENEHVSLDHVVTEAGVPTNSHYVLWYPPDRTILIKHEVYSYAFPAELEPPRVVYLSSLGEAGLPLHDALADWLEKHPKVALAFQPGTFQMAAGVERLKRIYARTDIFVANKEEYQRILKTEEGDPRKLMEMMRALGPKIVFLTDGGNGAYALAPAAEGDSVDAWFVDLYPDLRAPYERTGAGDAFAATAVCAILMDKTIKEALEWGPVNSMSVVQDIGAQKGLLTKDRLLDLLAHPSAPYGAKAL